jgi:hypothetical protein
LQRGVGLEKSSVQLNSAAGVKDSAPERRVKWNLPLRRKLLCRAHVLIKSICPVRRYDVIYGSHGFNTYGYKGGCAFANGTKEESLASPPSARYFCGEEDFGFKCLHDHAGSGFCFDYEFYDQYSADLFNDGFQPLQVRVAVSH